MQATLAKADATPRRSTLMPAPDDMRCTWVWKKGPRTGERCPKYGQLRSDGSRKNCCDSHGGKNQGRPPLTYEHVKMPTYLREHVEMARADPLLKGVTFGKEILMGMLLQTLAELEEGPRSAELWGSAQATFKDLRVAIRNKDSDTMAARLATLGDLITNGFGIQKKEEKIRGLLQEHKSLEETDIKRRDKLGNFVPAGDFAKAIGRTIVVLRELFETIDEARLMNGRTITGPQLLADAQARIIGVVSETTSRRASP